MAFTDINSKDRIKQVMIERHMQFVLRVMCGRCSQAADFMGLQIRFGFDPRGIVLPPKYNLAHQKSD